MCVCGVSFFLWQRNFVFLSSCWVWGRLLLSLFWCGCCAFSWGTCGFPQRVLQLVTLLGFRCLPGGVLIHHLVFYLVPAQLPLPLLTLRGCCNLSGSSLLAYSCGGALLLGWRCLCCVTWFSTMCCALPPGPAACAAYPVAGSLGDFQVTGCLSFCFPGDVGLASALPFFFCASPAPTGMQGLAGFCTLCQGAPVRVVSALWPTVSSPCWLSLTLGWVSFWTAVSPVSVGCEVCGLDYPSWFVYLFMSLFVLHLLLG